MTRAPRNLDVSASALFLDVDGTLLELRDNPADVRADRLLIALLKAAESCLDGAMSLISGRPIDDIDRIFDPVRFPAAGAHGAELRLAEDAPVAVADASLPDGIVARLREFVASRDALLLEEKHTGISLHYRNAPQLETTCRHFIAGLLPELEEDYRLIDGKMVLELAPRANDKGAAIREMLRHAPFHERRPVFIGDDVTDEDGFRAVNELGGVSIRVGSGAATAARYTLDDVDDVLAWLRSIVERVPV